MTITDIIRQYADGEIEFNAAREALREMKAERISNEPMYGGWAADDDYDVEGTVLEVHLAGILYDLQPNEVTLLVKSLVGQSYGAPSDEEGAAAGTDGTPSGEGDEPAAGAEPAGGDAPGFAYEITDDEPDEPEDEERFAKFSAPVTISKADKRKNLVFGWANVALKDGDEVLDRQNHRIDLEDLENAAYNFVMKAYGTGDMHTSGPLGQLVESVVITQDKIDTGAFPQDKLGHWWVGFKVPDENWEQVAKGERKMFSIEGKARLVPES